MSRRQEEREHTRLPIRLEVQVTGAGRTVVSGKTRDISREGMFVFVPKPLPRGTRCDIVLLVKGPTSTLRIEITGTVVRADDNGMAMDFTTMEIDSVFHLRNLMQYNMWMFEGKS
jgi:hypothetical protein